MLIKEAYASCPVCIVTVGGGLFIAEKLGIDSLLISIWISALNSAFVFWITKSSKNKYLKHPYFWSIILFLTTLWYFYSTKEIGHKDNQFLGIDKIVFGLIVGLIVSFVSFFTDYYTRIKNNGKVLFYYQKVIIPLVFLLLTTIIFNFFI